MKTINLLIATSLLLIFSCKQKNNNIVEEFYPDGTIKSEITVKNNMRNGLTKNYDEKGRLISTAEYVNDKHEGWLMNYNPVNGKMTMKAMYKDDEQDGPVTLFYREGPLFRESIYIKGRVDGVIKTYWPDGKLKAENIFKMGKPCIGLKEYDKNGNLIKQPEILIKVVNKTNKKTLLSVSLSSSSKEVSFYLEDLEEGKYFSPSTYKLRNDNGVSLIDIPGIAKQKITVIAKVKTNYDNTLILKASYNL